MSPVGLPLNLGSESRLTTSLAIPLVFTLVLLLSVSLLGLPSARAQPSAPVQAVSSVHAEHPATQFLSPHPLATTDDIYVDGATPSAVALHWDTTGDLCFTDYEIQESTQGSDGPWVTQGTISDSADYEWMELGFYPGETTWWQDVDVSGCGGGQQPSNIVSITNPAYSSLSYVDLSSSSIQLSWTNNAHYGGLLQFDDYQVLKQLNGGGYSTIDSITSASTTQYTDSGLSGLTTGAQYQYHVETTDQCSGTYCNGWPGLTQYQSNTVSQLSTSQPTASPISVDVGQTTSFHVAVFGGSGAYTYVWSGLPGGCGSSNSNPLVCIPTDAGTSSVSVTVTDSNGISATSLSVSVTVASDPSITSFLVTPTNPTAGSSMSLDVVASGGSGTLTYSYTELPTGCQSADTASLLCTPTATGSFNIQVSVTDANGKSTTSTLPVTVAAAPSGCTSNCGSGNGNGNGNGNANGNGNGNGNGGAGGGAGGSSSTTTFFTPLVVGGVVAVVAVCAVLVLAVLLLRGKPKAPPPIVP
jgi:hypothetical protein